MQGGKQRIQIMIEHMPSREQSNASACEKPSAEEKMREACIMIDSGHESREEWELVKKVNNHLMKLPKLNKRQANLLKMIQPTIKKYHRLDDEEIIQDSEKLQQIGAIT